MFYLLTKGKSTLTTARAAKWDISSVLFQQHMPSLSIISLTKYCRNEKRVVLKPFQTDSQQQQKTSRKCKSLRKAQQRCKGCLR
eukprot:5775153-Amphidinium_carterae.1